MLVIDILLAFLELQRGLPSEKTGHYKSWSNTLYMCLSIELRIKLTYWSFSIKVDNLLWLDIFDCGDLTYDSGIDLTYDSTSNDWRY